ncbi:UNVERIFIED_CONTAM: hypothetical protein FKN15_034141 [Acipenser sinensis]
MDVKNTFLTVPRGANVYCNAKCSVPPRQESVVLTHRLRGATELYAVAVYNPALSAARRGVCSSSTQHMQGARPCVWRCSPSLSPSLCSEVLPDVLLVLVPVLLVQLAQLALQLHDGSLDLVVLADQRHPAAERSKQASRSAAAPAVISNATASAPQRTPLI